MTTRATGSYAMPGVSKLPRTSARMNVWRMVMDGIKSRSNASSMCPSGGSGWVVDTFCAMSFTRAPLVRVWSA